MGLRAALKPRVSYLSLLACKQHPWASPRGSLSPTFMAASMSSDLFPVQRAQGREQEPRYVFANFSVLQTMWPTLIYSHFINLAPIHNLV